MNSSESFCIENHSAICDLMILFTDKWKIVNCDGSFLFKIKWFQLSAVGRHKLLPVAYPIFTFLPFVIEGIERTNGLSGILSLRYTLFAGFYSALCAILFHVFYVMFSPRAIKIFSSKDELIRYVESGENGIKYDRETAKVRCSTYWECVNCCRLFWRNFTFLLLLLSILCLLFIVAYNTWNVSRFILKGFW